MRFQQTEYWCGPASLQNALKALGGNATQKRLAEMAATTPDGTDDEGIKRAALALGHGVDELAETEPTKAWARLYGALLMGRPVVLCVDKWSHWVCAVGLCGQRVLVAEPGRYPYATKENGLLVVNSKRLLKRWKAAYRTTGARGPAFYGLAIGPAE